MSLLGDSGSLPALVHPPVEERPQDVTVRSLRGGGWLLARRVSGSLVSVVTIAVLARHLTPTAFGLVALASVVMQFATLVAEGGVGAYVVYVEGDRVEDRIRAAHWCNFALTCLQVLLCMAFLPLVGYLSDDSRLPGLVVGLAAVFFTQQFAVVPEALLQRQFRFRATAVRDILLNLAGAVASIVLAVRGAGVWALVAPALVIEPIRTVLAMALAGWLPGRHLHLGLWPGVLRYTWHLMGSNLLTLVANQGDTLLVGKLFGSARLGLYNVAWQLSNLVNRNVTAIVSRVSLAALGAVRHDRRRMQQGYLRMLAFLAIVCSPLLVGMGVLAGDLIHALYGSRWVSAAVILRIFVAFTLIRAVTSPSSMVYNVLGRTEVGFRFTLVFTPVYLLAILVGSQWGVHGVAAAVALTRAVGAVVDTKRAARQIDLRLRDVAAAVSRPFGVAGLMGVAVAISRAILANAGVDVWPRLIGATTVGGLVYVAAIAAIRPIGYTDVKRAVTVPPRSIGRRLRLVMRGSA